MNAVILFLYLIPLFFFVFQRGFHKISFVPERSKDPCYTNKIYKRIQFSSDLRTNNRSTSVEKLKICGKNIHVFYGHLDREKSHMPYYTWLRKTNLSMVRVENSCMFIRMNHINISRLRTLENLEIDFKKILGLRSRSDQYYELVCQIK